MYQIKVDPHTHTIASGHAFSTVGENAACAKRVGLEAIGLSDHFGPTFSGKDGPGWGPMMNMPALPRQIDGVTILASVEIDIMDSEGHLGFWDKLMPFRRPGDAADMTLNDPLLDTRDYAIASVHHFPGCENTTLAQNTTMYCRVLENPRINIIGHSGRAGLRFDLKEVCQTARDHNKMIEINDHSFDSDNIVTDECRRIAICCAELGTKIVVSSDAHSAWFVGQFQRALAMLDEIHFPEKLIANQTLNDFLKVVRR